MDELHTEWKWEWCMKTAVRILIVKWENPEKESDTGKIRICPKFTSFWVGYSKIQT